MIRKGIAWCDQIGQGIAQIAKRCGAWALMGWIGKDPEQQSGGPDLRRHSLRRTERRGKRLTQRRQT